MTELDSRQRAFLRTMANQLQDTVQIGKAGFLPTLATDLDQQLLVRELVKIHVLKSADEDPRTIAERAAQAVGAAVVQVVGRKVVLYRHSSKLAESGKDIQLPERRNP